MVAVCALSLAGCPNPVSLADADANNAPPDASPDANAPADASSDSPAADVAPRGSVAPMADPTPLPVANWLLADLANPALGDPVRQAIESGTFVVPMPGTQFSLYWQSVAPGDNGELGVGPRGGFLYGATQIEVSAGLHVFARMDTASGVFTNGVLQPGDIYASGRIRVPLAVRPGANVVLVRGIGGRGNVIAQLWTTPDEVLLNLNDMTVPDLVAGDMSELWLGVPLLNLTATPLANLDVRIEPSAQFDATTVTLPSLAPHAVTQLAFRLTPRRAYPAAGAHVTVGIRVESPSLYYVYRRDVTLDTVAAGTTYRRTFRSRVDGSTQYYGVVPPTSFDPMRAYGLVLSLHGASVEGIGQARAYSPKDWAFIIAPTNRRPFGFDWEEWGTLDAIEVLDHATASFHTASDRVYLTGHSMGGHGTWHVGLLFPGRFATLGPSAGWSSFVSYTGRAHPSGAFGRAQAAAVTMDFIGNLAQRGAYVIHGSADTNVPVTEGRTMVAAARTVTTDVQYHEEPGAGHWWDGMASPGADCVDWPPLFDFMRAHTLDPFELSFRFITPAPWVNSTHSFVTVMSELDARQNVTVVSARAGDRVTLTTTNVRGLRLSGDALRMRGIVHVTSDGIGVDVPPAGDIAVGPQDGKRPELHGPMNQVFHRPFCFVYPDAGSPRYSQYASYLTSVWAVIGNGQACAMPLAALTPAVRAEFNLVYVGVSSTGVAVPAGIPFRWDATAIRLADASFDRSAIGFIFPEGSHLSAVLTATPGDEWLLFRYQPFSSGAGAPDYFVFGTTPGRPSGFFTPTWQYVAGM